MRRTEKKGEEKKPSTTTKRTRIGLDLDIIKIVWWLVRDSFLICFAFALLSKLVEFIIMSRKRERG